MGVTYVKRLTFGRHVWEVTERMRTRNELLARVAGASWGWRKEDARKVYSATQRSVGDYASAAWALWISKTNIENITGPTASCKSYLGKYEKDTT